MTQGHTRTHDPALAGFGGALPGEAHPQEELLEGMRRLWADFEFDDGWLEHFYGAVGVESRHMALPLEEYFSIDGFGDANDHWIRCASKLGSDAVAEACRDAGIEPAELDALFFTTVTGVASPSIDAAIINKLELGRRVDRVPMFGLGCVGGAAGTARMADYLRGHPDRTAALVAVELCSLTVERSRPEIVDMIAGALFGDGAACLVGAGAERADDFGAGPRVAATRSAFYRDTEWVMGWEIGDDGFGLVLSGDLPEVIETELASDVDDFLDAADLARRDVDRWICHPGGPKVLDAIENALEFDEGEVAGARRSLREIGNLSSASVLHVLGDVFSEIDGSWGGPGVMMAMGPGFSAEFVLLH